MNASRQLELQVHKKINLALKLYKCGHSFGDGVSVCLSSYTNILVKRSPKHLATNPKVVGFPVAFVWQKMALTSVQEETSYLQRNG